MNSLIEIACVTHVSAFFLVIIRNGWSCGWMQNNVTSDSSSNSDSDSDSDCNCNCDCIIRKDKGCMVIINIAPYLSSLGLL